jgi:hypothetical protein
MQRQRTALTALTWTRLSVSPICRKDKSPDGCWIDNEVAILLIHLNVSWMTPSWLDKVCRLSRSYGLEQRWSLLTRGCYGTRSATPCFRLTHAPYIAVATMMLVPIIWIKQTRENEGMCNSRALHSTPFPRTTVTNINPIGNSSTLLPFVRRGDIRETMFPQPSHQAHPPVSRKIAFCLDRLAASRNRDLAPDSMEHIACREKTESCHHYCPFSSHIAG